MSVRPSVRPLFRWSITHKSKSGKTSVLDIFWGMCVGGMAWGVDGVWKPLPTRLQRYCDPVSLVLLQKHRGHAFIISSIRLKERGLQS